MEYVCTMCDKDQQGQGWKVKIHYGHTSSAIAHLCAECVDKVEWLLGKLNNNKDEEANHSSTTTFGECR